MENRIIVIDGNSLMNRAYFAIQTPMKTKEGITTHGIYGFLNMLAKIEKDYPYTHIVVTFDKKAPTFRHIQYQDYKANRKSMPDDLKEQFPILKDILNAMNIQIVELEGFEADDLIGTIARISEEEGLSPLIITGDKDALQLASEKTKVLITKTGISKFEIYDKEEMIRKYGLTPTQFIDLKALMGDKSDNIPGVAGIGEKTGIKLLLEYKTLENLLNSLDQLKGKVKETLQENKMTAIMSQKLATIHRFVPIDINISDYAVKEPDFQKLKEIYTKLEFKVFLKKLPSEYKAEPLVKNSTAKLVHKERKYINLNNRDDISRFISESKNEIYIHLFSDGGRKAEPQVYGIGIMSSKEVAYIDCESDLEIFDDLIEILSNEKVALKGHFLADVYYVFLNRIYNSKKLKKRLNINDGFYFNSADDSAISSYVLNPNNSKYELKNIYFEIFGEEIDEKALDVSEQISLLEDNEKYFSVCAYIADVLDAIFENHKDRLAREELENIYKNVELPLIEVMASMSAYGFSVEPAVLNEIGNSLNIKIGELVSKIHELAGENFNINSTQQLGIILFEKLGLKSLKKTKTGYSTSADILEKIKDSHPIIPLILEYRTLSKINSTYIEGLLPLIGTDNKIHANFQQTATATGRISCIEPNLQNIPIRQELGRNVRKAFVPCDGYVLTGADYSQIELRILAHLSNEPHLIEAFQNGLDIHKITASKVFKTPLSEVTNLQRSNAKAVNFGVIYGMSGFGLSEELSIDIKTAGEYIKEYFAENPKVADLMQTLKKEVKEKGYATTILGRKRYISEINSANFMVRQAGERLAMNTPIQGSAADIIKLAMINTYRALVCENNAARLILQIHDELIIETPKEYEERSKEILKNAMENAAKLNVNLEVDIHTAYDWYGLK
ncbi:MAG: DNA polymerase I [Eubacteriales bacterium]